VEIAAELLLPAEYAAAVELFRLGEWELAADETRAVMGSGHPAADALPLLVSAHLRGHGVTGVTALRRQLGFLPGPWETGARLWPRSLRLDYVDAIEAGAKRVQLPLSLLASIIRFESDYEPGLVSRADAIGLLQVRQETGDHVAVQCWHGRHVSARELKDPKRNLVLGAFYINGLFARHWWNWAFGLAAYNAGPAIMKSWLARFAGLATDELVEQLTYPGTVGYVKRILGAVPIYWSVYYPVLSPDAPQPGLAQGIPAGLQPFLDEPGGSCYTPAGNGGGGAK
jgi:soluble lytic murein transglycosylase